jgi:hypothetical protein
MKARVYFGTKLAHDRSRMRSIILEITATVLLAAAVSTSHAQGSGAPTWAQTPATAMALIAMGAIPAT